MVKENEVVSFWNSLPHLTPKQVAVFWTVVRGFMTVYVLAVFPVAVQNSFPSPWTPFLASILIQVLLFSALVLSVLKSGKKDVLRHLFNLVLTPLFMVAVWVGPVSSQA